MSQEVFSNELLATKFCPLMDPSDSKMVAHKIIFLIMLMLMVALLYSRLFGFGLLENIRLYP